MSGKDSPTFFHGQPWSSWVEKIGRDRPLSDEEVEDETSSSVMRLATDDIDLFGFCPKTDNFYGVICETCNAVIKPQALVKHMEIRHQEIYKPVTIPPIASQTNSQLNLIKGMNKTPYCKISKLKKSQILNHIVAGSAITSNAANNSTSKANNHQAKQKPIGDLQQYNSLQPNSPNETTPVQQSPNNLPNSQTTKNTSTQPKRKKLKTERSLLKDREYDPDKHCGVWNEESGKPCTRSLTCKSHTVSLRRAITGRSKPFDKLLAEHRASKEQSNNKTNSVKSNNNNNNSNSSVATANQSSSSITVTNAESTLQTTSIVELETPSSPPVLSLPDTFPLPQAVDYLYEISYQKMAPHGNNKTSKLEEEFSKEMGATEIPESSQEKCVVNSNSISTSPNNVNVKIEASGKTAPVTAALPSLSPIETENLSPQYTAAFIPRSSPISTNVTQPEKTSPVSSYVAPTQNIVFEARPAQTDINQSITIYPSLVFNSSSNGSDNHSNTQLAGQILRPAQISSRGFINLFNASSQQQIYDSDLTIAPTANGSAHGYENDSKIELFGDFAQSNLQSEEAAEATTPTTYATFGDIDWSPNHPEPLAVSTWLNFSANRKQFSWNIH